MWETWVQSLGSGRFPWRTERLPTPVFWPGEFHGLYSSWGCKELETTERLSLCHYALQITFTFPTAFNVVTINSRALCVRPFPNVASDLFTKNSISASPLKLWMECSFSLKALLLILSLHCFLPPSCLLRNSAQLGHFPEKGFSLPHHPQRLSAY